jgi:hypothetical protein
MPPGIPTRKTFQYQDPNQITPQVLQSNPGAFPAQLGQTLYSPLAPGYQGFSPINPGRNVQGQGFGNPFAPINPGRNVVGGGNMSLANTPGRNVVGGVQAPQPAPFVYSKQPVSFNAAAAVPGYVPTTGMLTPGIPTYTQSQGHPDPGLIQRLANLNPEEYARQIAAMPPSQRDAIDRLTSQQTGGSNSDFQNTKFMQENNAAGTDFYDQLRWDPDAHRGKGGYVKIGDLVRSGRLNERTNKLSRKQTQRGRGATAAKGKRTTSVGVVDFNISSG